MNNKVYWLIGGIIVIIGIVLVSRWTAREAPRNNPPADGQVIRTSPASEENIGVLFTRSDVATHNSTTSCYAIVSGTVYDLTSWIGKHPGGPEKIIPLCGTDATAAFSKQHGSSTKATTTLASLLIGSLSQ